MKVLTALLALAAGSLAANATDIAQDTDAAYTYEFNDITLDDANSISCRTVWQKDLSTIFPGTANDNNHGLFIIGNTLYVYTEGYYPNKIILHRFDLTTGNDLGALNAEYPESSGSGMRIKYVAPDDAGHIIAVIYDQPDGTSSEAYWRFDIYDADLNSIKKGVAYPAPYVTSDKIHRNLYFLSNSSCELCIHGDITSEAWSISCDTWAAETKPSDEVMPDGYPCHTEISFTADTIAKPVYTFQMYDNGGNAPYDRLGLDPGEAERRKSQLLTACPINDEYSLVQPRNTDNTPGQLSLFRRSSEGSPLFGQADRFTLAESLPTTSTLAATDAYCQGAFPFTVGNTSVVAIPVKYSATDGFKCKFAAFSPGTPSFDTMQELWEYPTTTIPEKIPETSKIYYRERPFVVAAPESAATAQSAYADAATNDYGKSTLVATYMPEAYLAVHRLKKEVPGIPSGINTSSAESAPVITVSGQTAEICCGTPTPVTIHSASGALLYSTTASGLISIDLSPFPATVCILRAGATTSKIVLQP